MQETNNKKIVDKNLTKQRIMDVALKQFAHNGFDGASTREICKEAGVNISLISYYFGGKRGLYESILNGLVQEIIEYMKSEFQVENIQALQGNRTKEQKIELVVRVIGKMVDYFYSEKVTKDKFLLLYREQIMSNITINSYGYQIFKRLFASIFNIDENDKEVIFRCITIVGQVHSARILSQFTLKLLNQEEFMPSDIELIKNILQRQVRAIIKDFDEERNEAKN